MAFRWVKFRRQLPPQVGQFCAAINSLHRSGVTRVYWTEIGNGAPPKPPVDIISGTVVVGVEAGAKEFTVSYRNGLQVERFDLKQPESRPARLMFD